MSKETKCDSCSIMAEVKNSKELACCAWYLEHAVIYGDSVEDCPVYKKNESVIL